MTFVVQVTKFQRRGLEFRLVVVPHVSICRSGSLSRWLVALNLKASIIVIHQARFGVKIPLPPSCGMGMGP